MVVYSIYHEWPILGKIICPEKDHMFHIKAQRNRRNGGFLRAKLKKEVPLNRFADSKEIAKLILYIASKDSAYINGVSIPIDGGRLKSF